MSDPQNWHRLFGYAWMDFFRGTDVEVQMEVDLSSREQFLDVVIIQITISPPPRRLPDGFENFGKYNLITFRSFQEALSMAVILELIGHLVNFRKRVSPSFKNLLSLDEFRLYAVNARFPEQLNGEWPLMNIREGVYELRIGPLPIRVIVLNELPQEEHNAVMHLFTAREDLIRFGQQHYRPYSSETSSILLRLLREVGEDLMADSFEEFIRKTKDELFGSLTPDEQRRYAAMVPPEVLLKVLPLEERLKGLSVEELVKGLSPETREALMRQLLANQSAPKSEG